MSKKIEVPINFLGGSPLNRLSWLRSSPTFLNSALASPLTRWIIFQAGQPLITSRPERSLARLSTADVKSLLGAEPFFGQGKEPGEEAAHDVPVLESARHRGPIAVFLGLDEPEDELISALPSSDFSAKHQSSEILAEKITGTPYFALDVSEVEQEKVDALLKEAGHGKELSFAEPRGATSSFSVFEAAVFAEARSMLDWNIRNRFCPACGSPTYSIWGGWKLSCSSLLPWADNTGRKPCPSAKGLHNFAHPRTDAVVIMAILDETGDKILLGRNKKFPAGFYSTLAGFIEPGEMFEDAVKREIWEEAGVTVWDVRYHSSQPWPYPANLMVGFYATADPAQPIRLDLDNELADARWYTRAEILAVLAHPQGNVIQRREYKKFDEPENVPGKNNEEGHSALAPSDPSVQARVEAEKAKEGEGKDKDEGRDLPPFRVPPLTAIAGVLISDWANGKAGVGSKSSVAMKGNL